MAVPARRAASGAARCVATEYECGAVRENSMTVHLRAENSSATARPIPREPPVRIRRRMEKVAVDV